MKLKGWVINKLIMNSSEHCAKRVIFKQKAMKIWMQFDKNGWEILVEENWNYYCECFISSNKNVCIDWDRAKRSMFVVCLAGQRALLYSFLTFRRRIKFDMSRHYKDYKL